MPFFNEEKTLELALTNLISEDFADEIILINDGSIDSSSEIAEKLYKKYKNVNLINSQQNRGKGYALRLGINVANGEYIGVLDADLEYSPKDLKKLFEKIKKENLEIVCGSRFIGNSIRKNVYLRTYLANKILSNFFSKIYRSNVTDVATCLKVFKNQIIKDIKFESEGFSIEIELLAKTIKKTKKYHEYPIEYFARTYEEGKKIKFEDGIRYFIAILKYRN
jgi:glycosyltransferase involved in cell wall biosynthesis